MINNKSWFFLPLHRQEEIQGCSWCYDGCILRVQKVIWHGDRLNYCWSVWIWGGSPLTFIRNCHRFNPNGPQMWKPQLPQTSLPGCNLSSDLLLLNMTRFCRGENWRKQHTWGAVGWRLPRETSHFILSGDSGSTWRRKPLCLFPKSKTHRPEPLGICSQGKCLHPEGEQGSVEGNKKG